MLLAKAKESVGAARVCFDHDYFNSSVSRAYYAVFQAQAAQALRWATEFLDRVEEATRHG